MSEIIIFAEDIQELRGVPLAYIPNIENKYLQETFEADILRTALPSRVLISNKEIWIPPIAWIAGNALDISKDKDLSNKYINNVLIAYDKWIEYLILRLKLKQQISISFYFDNLDLYEKWNVLLSKEILINEAAWMAEDAFLQVKDNNETEKSGSINVWRHIKADSNIVTNLFKKKHKNRPIPIYFEAQTFSNPFFSLLCSIKPGSFMAAYVMRQLIEAALLRVLVIDDRIANYLNNLGNEDRDNRIRALDYMRISIAGVIKINNIDVPLIDDKSNRFKIIELMNNGKINDKLPYDMVFLHQTIFDDKMSIHLEQRGCDKRWREKWVYELKKTIPFVIFHSGRGKSQMGNLPENVRFLEYSALHRYILVEPSKYFLCLLAMSAVERK